jgi:hypothetical protein
MVRRSSDERGFRDHVIGMRVDEKVLATVWLGEEVTEGNFSYHIVR